MAIDGPNPLGGVGGSRVVRVGSSPDRANSPGVEESEGTRFTLTDGLAGLLGSVRETAEIRQEVIGEVARRLASGELLTRRATEETVQGLLESNALNSF